MGTALRGDAGQVAAGPVRRRQDGRDPAPARLGDAPGRAVRLHRQGPRAGRGDSWEARARNPDDQGWGAEQDATKAVAGWNRSLRRVRRAVRQRPDHAVVVEYDRFFGDPAGSSLDRVLAWLGLDRTAEVDAAFAEVHRTYVEKVAPKERTLSPETLAFLDEHAERDVWDQVTTQLAL